MEKNQKNMVEMRFVSGFVGDVSPCRTRENLKGVGVLTEKKFTYQIITETFILVNNMLISNENINSLFSGSTCVNVMCTPEKKIIHNIGDSRDVLDGEFVGRQRVWLKDEEVPGLAITRSFGDRVNATLGVISKPEIKEFDFEENDKFMAIASDRIWKFISSQECVNIIKDFYRKMI